MLLLSYSLYVIIDVLIIVGGTYYMKHSIISLVMRVCGVIIGSALLRNWSVANLPRTDICTCFLVVIFFIIICCCATFYNYSTKEKNFITCMIALILGIPLAFFSIESGHPVCAGALLVINTVSTAFEYASISE